jgi:hypothetical protein
MNNPSFPLDTLIIDRWDSECNACGGNVLDIDRVEVCPGCGVKFLHRASSYIGLNMKELTGARRPDLEWVGYDL